MRRLALLWLLGCGPTLQQAPGLRHARALESAPPEATCNASNDDWVLDSFIAPIGGDAFRRSTWRAALSLRCCDAEDGLESQRLVVEFVPESPELARARLASFSTPLEAAVETCLQAQVARWVMRPAPRSDVIRRRLSPFGPRFASSPEPLRVALPAFPARAE